MSSDKKKQKISLPSAEEVSADTLLGMLHADSDENGKDRNNTEITDSTAKSESNHQSSLTEMKIDDEIFDLAKDTLSEQQSDNPEEDVDALIAKYIGRMDSAVAEEALTEDILSESISPKDEKSVPGGISFEDLLADGLPEDDEEEEPDEDKKSDGESAADSFDEEQVAADDSDMNDGMGTDSDDNAHETDGQTAEPDDFDTGESVETVGMEEQSPDNAETEVFTPVSDEVTTVMDIPKLSDDGEPPELSADSDGNTAAEKAESDKDAKVYGEPASSDIDQTDINLMIAFGVNEEMKDKIGESKAKSLAADMEKKNEATMQQPVVQRFEYTDRSQNIEILTEYRNRYYTLILRIAAAIVLFGVTFLLENSSLFGLSLPAYMRPDSYPVVYAMIDLQFIVFCGALAGHQLIDGFRNMVTLKPTPESITALTLLFSVVYTVAACFFAPKTGFTLYNLPVTVAVVLALIYEFMNLKRDVFSFNVISSRKKKFVVNPVSDATASLERSMFADYIPNNSQIIRVGKADFVDGFFSRVDEKALSKPLIAVTLPLVVILSVGFFLLTFLRGQNLYESLTMSFLAFTVTVPLTSFMIHSYPFYKAAKTAYDAESAIIGEVSLGEYASSSVISFEDREVFPSAGVRVTSIKVFGNNRIDEIIYYLASAFMTVGGPLADVFSQATHDLGHSENVELYNVEDTGFTIEIDQIPVSIGKADFMKNLDLEAILTEEDEKLEESGDIGVLFVAYKGQLAAKVYVQYTIDNEFEKILSQLYRTGMCVGLKSFDPNINDLMLSRKIKAEKYPVKVIRSKTVEDIPHSVERCSSGIVSKRSVKELLRTVASCERVSTVIKTNLIVKILAMLIGVIVAVFIYGLGSEIEITSVYTALYQIFWVIPVLILSAMLV